MTNTTRIVADRVEDLVAGASQRRAVAPADGKSGSSFELVAMDGDRYFLKTLCLEQDWISRLVGDREHWTLKLWTAGVHDAVPDVIDHALVAMALEGSGPSARLGMLMRDVGDGLVPEGDTTIPLATHLRFLDHMAALHATFWDWRDDLGLLAMGPRVRFFAPDNIAPEVAAGDPPVPVRVADEGWRLLAERAPGLHELVTGIHLDPETLVGPLRRTPWTFLHGDWKLGNLGEHPDGRTILLDWAYPGEGPACWELAWYLALNAARLPHPKEDAVAAYRAALERRGVETGPWWDAQLGLCLLGIMVTFAWEKAVGGEDELRWWEARASEGARWLG